MKVSYKTLGMNIAARQVLTITVTVVFWLGASVLDSQAYSGFCDYGGCCSENSDCDLDPNLEEVCIQYRGMCFDPGSQYCNQTNECPLILPDPPYVHYACIPIGKCMGGSRDGADCAAINGGCGLLPILPCYSSLDCGILGPCDPDWAGMFNDCAWGGGTCVPCVQGCSIATVALGTELQDRIDVLRSFRDKYLLNNAAGKAFITAYYEYSPPVADYIAKHEWLKSLVRIVLIPVIAFVSLFV